MYKKILIAADGSAHSLKAVEHALYLAKHQPGSHVTVMYAVGGKTAKADVLRHWGTEGIAEMRMEKMRSIEEKAKQAGIDYTIKIIRGEPAPALVAYAKEHHMDIIIVGSRGLNVMKEIVLGSVSKEVSQKAKCPVLIVK